MERSQISEQKLIERFVLGGNAYFTIVNPDTGARYTFRVRQRKNEDGTVTPYFVSVLNGPDNTSHYRYLGVIFDGKNYRRTKKSRISDDAPSAKCFAWLWKSLSSQKQLSRIEFWHEGRCGICGRKLTVPESIEAGIGPVCERRI